MDQPPQDPTQPTPPAAQPPGPAWGQPPGGWARAAPVMPATPRGPVTTFSKVAGIIIVLVGLGLTALGGGAFVFSVLAYTGDSQGLGEWFGLVLLVIGVGVLLPGIGILRGEEWGRAIGIFYGGLAGFLSFGFGQESLKDGRVLSALICGLVVVASVYVVIVLLARWRGPATA